MNDTSIDSLQKFAAPTIRIGIGLMLLWFGASQVFGNIQEWASYVPQHAIDLTGLTAETLALANGFVEIVFGIALVFGVFTRISALLMAIHIASIAIIVGFNSIGVRDWGLAAGALSTFFYGADSFTYDWWDTKRKQKKSNNV